MQEKILAKKFLDKSPTETSWKCWWLRSVVHTMKVLWLKARKEIS